MIAYKLKRETRHSEFREDLTKLFNINNLTDDLPQTTLLFTATKDKNCDDMYKLLQDSLKHKQYTIDRLVIVEVFDIFILNH